MKVALITPIYGRTGGPEIFSYNLAKALLKEGVDVTIFAPGDWNVDLKKVPIIDESLWNMRGFKDQSAEERRALIVDSQIKAVKAASDFDLLHFNVQKYSYLAAKESVVPCILTLHNKILKYQYKNVLDSGLCPVALSKEHAEGFNIPHVVNMGIDVGRIKPSYQQGDYLITAGRVTERNGVHRAIKVAQKSNKKLLIFGRVGNSVSRRKYFKEKIEPQLSDDIVFMGQVSHDSLMEYVKNAQALLYPIMPKSGRLTTFPLLVAEALASGTPVIGAPIKCSPTPSLPQNVGCQSNDLKELISAANDLNKFNRHGCRKFAEKYLDSFRMAKEYIKVYKDILSKQKK